MAMADGLVKKTPLVDFSRPRNSGIRAVDLDGDRRLVGVGITDGNKDILLFSNSGKAVRFDEAAVRAMGRTARGVRGIKMAEGDSVISLIIVDPESDASKSVLTSTIRGYGKRTLLENYPRKGRATKGVISIQTSDRNGDVVAAVLVEEGDEAMLITSGGTLIRTRIVEISIMSRNTQGVRLIGLGKNEDLVSLARVCESEDDKTDDENASEEEPDSTSSD
jgi:DNA gyrase subunit A